MPKYRVTRIYRDHDKSDRIAGGLTLAEAQEICRDPETSSSTCRSKEGRIRTIEWGPWFVCYDEDKEGSRSAKEIIAGVTASSERAARGRRKPSPFNCYQG